MRRVLPFAATSLLLALQSAAPLAGQITDRDGLIAELDSTARAHAADSTVAGVAVVQGSDALLLDGFGYADLEFGVPTPADPVYEIGSVTKQFTAAAVLQLVEDGSIDVDADVTDYLPDLDTRGHQVSVRRLLNHASGIRSYTAMPFFRAGISQKDLPRDTLVSLIGSEPFDFEPGTALIYNDSAFFLLGLMIEEVSGQSSRSTWRSTFSAQRKCGIPATATSGLQSRIGPTVMHGAGRRGDRRTPRRSRIEPLFAAADRHAVILFS